MKSSDITPNTPATILWLTEYGPEHVPSPRALRLLDSELPSNRYFRLKPGLIQKKVIWIVHATVLGLKPWYDSKVLLQIRDEDTGQTQEAYYFKSRNGSRGWVLIHPSTAFVFIGSRLSQSGAKLEKDA